MSDRDIADRIAGAPISWGVCEVPGWGYQLTPDRVLSEMVQVGLSATEFGPDGFLALDVEERAGQLAAYGMQAVGGFLPVLLHDAAHDPRPQVDRFIDGCHAAGAEVVVLAAVTGSTGYDARPDLDDDGWETMLRNMDLLTDHAAARGVTAVLHPHVGTMVESRTDVERVLAGSRVGLCVDTGHLLVGGTDPVVLTKAHVDRVAHVHLKDVDQAMADRVAQGELAFGSAVGEGLFRPLGSGDVDIAALVNALEGHGYQGWYVLEQDVQLTGEPAGEGPVSDVRASIDFLAGLYPAQQPHVAR